MEYLPRRRYTAPGQVTVGHAVGVVEFDAGGRYTVVVDYEGERFLVSDTVHLRYTRFEVTGRKIHDHFGYGEVRVRATFADGNGDPDPDNTALGTFRSSHLVRGNGDMDRVRTILGEAA